MNCHGCGTEVPAETWRCWACGRSFSFDTPVGGSERFPYFYQFFRAQVSAFRPQPAGWHVVLCGIILATTLVVPLLLDWIVAEQGSHLSANLIHAIPEESRAAVPLQGDSHRHSFSETASTDGLTIQVSWPEHLAGVAGQAAPDGKELVIANIVLNAVEGRPIQITRSTWEARDQMGNIYSLARLPGEDWLKDGLVQPGEEMETWLAFFLPVGRKPDLHYRAEGHRIVHVWGQP